MTTIRDENKPADMKGIAMLLVIGIAGISAVIFLAVKAFGF